MTETNSVSSQKAFRNAATALLGGALLLATAVASAQSSPAQSAPTQPPSSDALAPFVGTWSGMFTTQDNEFWTAADLMCFPGCELEHYKHMSALLADPANDARPVAELNAIASAAAEARLEANLSPLGKEVRKANAPETDPKLHCQPYGFVREATNPLPLEIRRDGEHLVVRYEEWSLLRTIYMDGRQHPAYRTPTPLGHSVGHMENGVLVVETTQLNADWISDASHAGHSNELKAVERYTVRDNPRRLELELTISDRVMLRRPVVMTKIWLATPGVELLQDRCGEIPGKY
jgi:hypothetical protein